MTRRRKTLLVVLAAVHNEGRNWVLRVGENLA